jgi:D-alanine-D-alanine ligase
MEDGMLHDPLPPLRIAVLAGGDSAERGISLKSGRSVEEALLSAGHDIVLIDPAETDLERARWEGIDACLIVLHGGAGEDGRIQRRLEGWGVAYTGSGPAASRLAMSKSASKKCFGRHGVPTCPCALLRATDTHESMAARAAPLGYPLVIKPDSEGSSLGLSVIETPAGLSAAAACCFQFGELALAEPLIRGREFTVAILGREALPILEILPAQRLFDYEAKYARTDTRYSFDLGLPPSDVAMLEQVAVRAAEALGTSGLVRVDVMVDAAGQPWVLEVNTVPGLTGRSLAPLAAVQAGLNLTALGEWMVRDCLALEVAR